MELTAQRLGGHIKKTQAAERSDDSDDSDQLQASQQSVTFQTRGKDKKRGRKGSGTLELDLKLSDSSRRAESIKSRSLRAEQEAQKPIKTRECKEDSSDDSSDSDSDDEN